jgi:hypothetical protein
MSTQLKTGSPFAAELDVRLKSDEPLSSIVAWWDEKYDEWRPTIGDKYAGVGPISDREWSVFCLYGAEDDPDPGIQKGWDFLRKDRAALQASVTAP